MVALNCDKSSKWTEIMSQLALILAEFSDTTGFFGPIPCYDYNYRK